MKVQVQYHKIVELEGFVEVTEEEYKILKRYNETNGFLDLPDDEYNAMDDPDEQLYKIENRLERTIDFNLERNEWVEDGSLCLIYDDNSHFILEK